MTARAYAVDLIQSIGEKAALTSHLEEHLIDGMDVSKILVEVLNLRRKQMKDLMELAEKPNPKYWCDFKHAVKAFTLDTEVYEAEQNETNLENMKRSADILAGVTSLFLGLEFASCARCLYDQLLIDIKKKEKEEN
jgi:hypothetical protein|nr:MAG TPA: hypothetical protein [Caudoviricetes sp.]